MRNKVKKELHNFSIYNFEGSIEEIKDVLEDLKNNIIKKNIFCFLKCHQISMALFLVYIIQD